MRDRRKADRTQESWNDPDPPALPQMALGWLRDILQSEFASAPDFDRAKLPVRGLRIEGVRANRRKDDVRPEIGTDPLQVAARFARGDVEDALWHRNWRREWRRLQLPDQLVAYSERLQQARTTDEVYTTLSQHAVQIVGGYTCLVFLPQEETAPLRPLPNSQLRCAADQLSIPAPVADTGLIGAADALREDSRFRSLAPLFSEERAVSLAHAPLGSGGMIVLVERRHERVFSEEDWYLLRALTAQAEAALERIRLSGRLAALADTDPLTGLASSMLLSSVLAHAWALAQRGQPLSVAVVAVRESTGSEAGQGRLSDDLLRAAAVALRQEVGDAGIALCGRDHEFVVVLPQATYTRTSQLLARVRGRLAGTATAHFGIATAGEDTGSPEELIAAARARSSQDRIPVPGLAGPA